MNICQNERKVTVDRFELQLKCQVGIHNSGHCRMVIPGTDVLIMFPGPVSYTPEKVGK